MTREALLTRTLVELTDTLVDEFDIVDLLTVLSDRCVELLDVDAAGIMLIAPDGEMRVMASSSDAMRKVELFELQSEQGPCLDCYQTGKPVADPDLSSPDCRWPQFAPVALSAGFRATDAVPMRLRQHTIGALNLFQSEPGSLGGDDLTAAQALADGATIAILQHRAMHEARSINDQLHHALKSRIVIEQAKGIVAERQHLDMSAAFIELRTYAQRHGRRLGDVARDVVEGGPGSPI